MRILHVSPGFPPDRIGGIEYYVSLVAERLKSRGHEVSVLVPRWRQKIKVPGVRQVAIPVGFNQILAYAYWSSLARLLVLSGRFDILHCHGLEGNLLAAQSLLHCPTVVHVHNLILPEARYADNLEHSVGWTIYLEALRRAGRLISPTFAVKQKMMHDLPFVSDGKVSVVPHAIDTEHFSPDRLSRVRRSPLHEDNTLILYLGKIKRSKGIEDICKAYRLIRNHNIKLVVAGAPTATTHFFDYLRKTYPEAIFTGKVADPRTWYHSADIFCIYTPGFAGGETFAMALAEAMSMGLAIVCSDNPIYREVTAGSALYVKPDDPQALSAELKRLASDEELRSEMGARAREVAIRAFHPDKVIPVIERIYLEVSSHS